MTKGIQDIPGYNDKDLKTGDNTPQISEAKGFAGFQQALFKRYPHEKVVGFWLTPNDFFICSRDPHDTAQILKLQEKPAKLYVFADEIAGSEVEHRTIAQFLKRNLTVSSLLSANFPKITQLLDQNITKVCSAAEESRRPIDVSKAMKLHAISIITNCIYGGDFSDNPNSYVETIETYFDAAIALSRSDNESDKTRFAKIKAEALSAANKIIDSAIANRSQSDPKDDFLSIILAEEMDPAKRRNRLHMATIGGYHTTASALTWVLYFVSQQPNIIAEIQAELDRVHHGKTIFALNDMSSLPYLTRVVAEALRLEPPGSFTARQSSNPMTIGEYELPGGANFFVPIKAICRNKDITGDDADNFNPARARIRHQSNIPFGSGARACPAQSSANKLVMLTMAQLFSQFNISLEASSTAVLGVERFVTVPDRPINMLITKRNVTSAHPAIMLHTTHNKQPHTATTPPTPEKHHCTASRKS